MVMDILSFKTLQMILARFRRRTLTYTCLIGVCVLLIIYRYALNSVSPTVKLLDSSKDQRSGLMTVLASLNSSSKSDSVPRSVNRMSPVVVVVSQLFNNSCPHNLLGLPDYVSAVCSKHLSPNSPCHHLTCRHLLEAENSGKSTDALYAFAQKFLSKNKRKILSDEAFVSTTSDCGEFRRSRGFDRKSAIKEDADFSIAFNILVHRDVELVSNEDWFNNNTNKTKQRRRPRNSNGCSRRCNILNLWFYCDLVLFKLITS